MKGGVAFFIAQVGTVEVVPALGHRRDEGLEGRRVAAQVDEHGVEPCGGPHRLQAMLRALEAFARVAVGAADHGRRAKRAVQVVGPGMVGAADRAARPRGLVHQHHAAVAAHVVEDVHLTIASAQHEERQAGEFERHGIAHLRHAPACADAGPGAGQEHILLPLGEGVRHIGLVRQPARPLFDRAHHVRQCGAHARPALPPAICHGCVLQKPGASQGREFTSLRTSVNRCDYYESRALSASNFRDRGGVGGVPECRPF